MSSPAGLYNVRGPYRIANYIRRRVEKYPTGVSVAKWMYGESHPAPEHMESFAEVFGLTEREQVRLAYAYTFRFVLAS